MIKAVFLDMDDTLIVNTVLYEQAAAVMSGFMHHYGVPLIVTRQKIEQTDHDLFKTQGYSRARYPDVFESVLRHFAPAADEQAVATVRGFAENVFTTIARVKPGTLEAIGLLADHFPSYIITQGDKAVQEARLAHLPFRDKLSGTFVVERKETAAFLRVIGSLGIAPSEAVMIGDSLKSDIVPSVEAGMHAIWIEAHNWSVEAAAGLPPERAYTFSSLLEAARYLTHQQPPEEWAVLRDSIKRNRALTQVA